MHGPAPVMEILIFATYFFPSPSYLFLIVNFFKISCFFLALSPALWYTVGCENGWHPPFYQN